MHAMILNFFF